MNLSFLFRSSTLPHAAISCHVNATFCGRILAVMRAIFGRASHFRQQFHISSVSSWPNPSDYFVPVASYQEW
jgi:hypothetical protein